ncbi:hypothetical protein NUU61_003281 [Penicillium alfredii]|uniref:Uncharacterized protein n=1 Tax=Penicillium alfredii TaxID=1506179 RepID=A0A9W9FT99_9EURO|nr:uncharacterized protein NUU61_003281 [Penicillium alfredii]KAJ5105934.1 hypothetical protein NUU61_003281 [Penicillium alfredii]
MAEHPILRSAASRFNLNDLDSPTTPQSRTAVPKDPDSSTEDEEEVAFELEKRALAALPLNLQNTMRVVHCERIRRLQRQGAPFRFTTTRHSLHLEPPYHGRRALETQREGLQRMLARSQSIPNISLGVVRPVQATAQRTVWMCPRPVQPLHPGSSLPSNAGSVSGQKYWYQFDEVDWSRQRNFEVPREPEKPGRAKVTWFDEYKNYYESTRPPQTSGCERKELKTHDEADLEEDEIPFSTKINSAIAASRARVRNGLHQLSRLFNP